MWVLMKVANIDVGWSTDWLDLNRKQAGTKNAIFKEEILKRLKIQLKSSEQETKIIPAADFSGRTEAPFVSFRNACMPFWTSCLQPPFCSFATLLGCIGIYAHQLYQASKSTSSLSSSFLLEKCKSTTCPKFCLIYCLIQLKNVPSDLK